MSISHRPYGSRYQISNLPVSIPIIGIGGSSFSCFYENHLSTKKLPLTTFSISKKLPIIDEWIKTIHYAIQNGATYIDTAPWYGYGISETIIGYALEELFNPPTSKIQVYERKDLIIATKIGRYEPLHEDQFDYSSEMTIISIEKSIERLNCKYLDIVQIHDVEFVPNLNILMEQTIPVLVKCRDEYKYMNVIGITGYPLEIQYEILVKAGQRGMKFDQSLTYSHCNLHDNSLFTRELILKYDNNDKVVNSIMRETKKKKETTTFVNYCHDNQILSLAAAPLSMGLLTHKNPPNWHPASQKLKQACQIASEYCQEQRISISNLALLYSLSFRTIACTILGMKNIEQVKIVLSITSKFNIHSVNKPIPTSTCRQIKNVWSLLNLICTKQEHNMLQYLLDINNGPFQDVQLNENYQWDGIEMAKEFWIKVKEKRTLNNII